MSKPFLALGGLLGSAFVLIAVPALAQDAPSAPPPPADGGHVHRPFFQRPDFHFPGFADLDANHDGKLDKAELAASMRKMADKMADRMFARMDSNHDGSVSEAEFDAARPPHGPHGGMPDPGVPGRGMPDRGVKDWHHHDMKHHEHGPMDFQTMDTDGDGKISFAEFSARMKARFDRLDVNHDGVLEASELPQPRAGGAPDAPAENAEAPPQK